MAFDVLKDRGFVQQVTDEDAVRALLAGPTVTVYIGYDPTADSLHVGNLFTLMAFAHVERAGHRCIALMGGGTAMVGDPSGKTEMRQLLQAETIAQNRVAIEEQVGRILNIEDGKSFVVNNADWLLELNYIDFLREIGRHFSVNRMLAAEAYKMRLERGLSFIEFNYQLLQSYDFVELRRRFGCILQMGGDDQWGNIVAGVDLCRRMDSELVHGLTFPLQLTATGEKMGKTAAGAVWLSADKVRPFDYYQYWVNTHDDDVVRMLGFFTFLPMPEVRAVGELTGVELNMAKSILAFETTQIIHGAKAALEAHRAAMASFGDRVIPSTILPASAVPRRGEADLSLVPTTTIGRDELEGGLPLIELMTRGGLAKSKGEARRLIGQGAVKMGEARVSEQLRRVGPADFADSGAGALILRVGKKKIHRFVLAE